MTTYFSDCTNYYEDPSDGYSHPYYACQTQNCSNYINYDFAGNNYTLGGKCTDSAATTPPPPPPSDPSDVTENFQLFNKGHKNLIYIIIVLLILLAVVIGGVYLYKKQKE